LKLDLIVRVIICLLLKVLMVLYSIIGGLIGFGTGFLICRLRGISVSGVNSYVVRMPSEGELTVIFATIIGAAVGFGYGGSRYLNGNYLTKL
jgi:hypothetical protein